MQKIGVCSSGFSRFTADESYRIALVTEFIKAISWRSFTFYAAKRLALRSRALAAISSRLRGATAVSKPSNNC